MAMKSMLTTFTNVLAFSCNLIRLSNANEFLKVSPHNISDRVSEEDIRTSLLMKIESSLPDPLGSSSASDRFSQLKATLEPIFAALPKNKYGNLEHTASSYALHRLFVLHHGWAIHGLSPSSGKFNSSSPAGILKHQVPSYIEDLFDQHLGGKGFKLHDLAVLAATLEHLIREEAIRRLGAAFNIHDTKSDTPGILSYSVASEMLDTYMTGYILSEDLSGVTPEIAGTLRSHMPEMFEFWSETQEFVRAIQRNITLTASRRSPFPSATLLDYASLAEVTQAVHGQFGSFFHDTACRQMKSNLLKLEYRSSGRVKLSEFYKPALDGNAQFQESVGYLRESGVLEENDLQEPTVMIANYMAAPSNCLASSGFYSICCKNECEGLLGYLEKNIAAPEARPEIISALAAQLPSSSTPALGTLSDTLLGRLDEIAAHHGGMVPLHSRLFAQWMHHAYPRECPYPHVSGTTSAKLPEEWLMGVGDTASEEEMLRWTESSTTDSIVNTTHDVNIEDFMTWSPEEELLVIRPIGEAPQSTWASTKGTLRSMMLFSVAVSVAYVLVQTTKGAPFAQHGAPEKFIV